MELDNIIIYDEEGNNIDLNMKPVIPFDSFIYNKPMLDADPCAGCSNNPSNNPHASGVCSCTLPYMNNPNLLR